ncbi:anaphase-promoting complex subunit 5 [Bradysia coprophila]|uniref:anaphase-promoting complex subunit 5 n=1 Tax=Bradysia coprophila TaxID=38358 RepID=UPI00187DB76D|nr:anaphase-promoting complex subunit 5 [Bradysia coprophila]XP_037044354.1 anaphase-promoting complex subunit 5 [Bradysia coprophila]
MEKKEIDALNIYPNKSNKIDVLTPHKIIVVFLVQEYVNLKCKLLSDASSQNISYPAKYRRKFTLLLLKLIQYPDLPYMDLHNLLTSKQFGLSKEHLESFESLMEMLNDNGVEILLDLQKFVEKMMSENVGINQFGILILYIRRIVMLLDRLTFDDMMKLFKDIKMYYEKGMRGLLIAPSSNITEMTDDNPILMKTSQSKWSMKQADFFVSQQCHLLENNERRALSPIDLQNKLKEVIQDNPLHSQAHILSYMNNLRVRDYLNSLEAFHRAFDRSAVKSHNPPETKGFQYSSLNLSIMHAQFGNNKEALASLKECIMLAQEVGDQVCLQLAQSWLCLLDKSNIQLNMQSCERNISNQTELTLVHSVSLGMQFVVNVAAISGFLPSKLFELLMKSEVINFQHTLMDLITNCIAQKAAVWTMYGKNEMASLCSQLLLQAVRTHAKRENDSMENCEAICHSLCCIALWLAVQGEFSLSSVVLYHTQNRFPRDPMSRYWMICDGYITALSAIYQHQWDVASKACSKVYTLDRNVSLLQRARLNIARRNLTGARKILENLLTDDVLEPLNRVRAMILLANTKMNGNSVSADVVTILKEALIYANAKYFSYEAAIVDVNFAFVLLNTGMPTQALKTITGCMDTVLANGGLYDTAKTMFLFVKCLIAAEPDADRKLSKMNRCKDILEETVEKFTKLGCYAKVMDVYIYLAQFYNEAQQFSERNKFAMQFRLLESKHPIPLEYLNVFF